MVNSWSLRSAPGSVWLALRPWFMPSTPNRPCTQRSEPDAALCVALTLVARPPPYATKRCAPKMSGTTLPELVPPSVAALPLPALPTLPPALAAPPLAAADADVLATVVATVEATEAATVAETVVATVTPTETATAVLTAEALSATRNSAASTESPAADAFSCVLGCSSPSSPPMLVIGVGGGNAGSGAGGGETVGGGDSGCGGDAGAHAALKTPARLHVLAQNSLTSDVAVKPAGGAHAPAWPVLHRGRSIKTCAVR